MKNDPFVDFVEDYERWFEKYRNIYLSELEAVRSFIPDGLNGIEIGVGTGRFAAPLNIKTGIEPSSEMAKLAREKGIEVLAGKAEKLPVEDETYDFALFVTTICFVKNIRKSLKEARRIIKKDGFILIGFVDKASKIGGIYRRNRNKSKFYRTARFYSIKQIIGYLKRAGFEKFSIRQTLFEADNDLNSLNVQETLDGFGEGGFVVVKAEKGPLYEC
jgi:ubiquinone/menaquinone biosynthesis C-methylase UbiE